MSRIEKALICLNDFFGNDDYKISHYISPLESWKAIKREYKKLKKQNNGFKYQIHQLIVINTQLQSAIEKLKAKVEEAYEEGFKNGQHNILEAEEEGR